MSLVQILAQNILVFYGLLGLASIWLAYEIVRTVKQRRVIITTEDPGWPTPSPENAWTPKPEKPSPVTPVQQIQIQSTVETDPLKQFFQKEHVTEPITTNINRPRKPQP